MRMKHFTLFFLFLFVAMTSCQKDQAPAYKHNDNTVRVRLPADIKTLNPYLYRTGYENTVHSLIFQALMDFEPESLKMAPQLVKSPATIEDIAEGENAGGQRFTFEILDEAVWDDGKPVTGQDFEFTLKALFNPKAPTQRWLAYLDYLTGIEVDPANPKRFSVLTNSKYFLAQAAISTLVVLPKHIYDPEGVLDNFSFSDLASGNPDVSNDERLQQYADRFGSPEFARETVSGSGPYSLVEWVDGQRVVLAKKPNWWGDALADKFVLLQAYPDTIIFLPMPDQTAAATALRNQDLDVSLEVDSRLFVELRDDPAMQEVYNFFNPPRFVFYYIPLNTKNPKLADKRVRRALAHLLNMQEVIDVLYDGFGEPLVGPFLPDKPYYHKDLPPIQQDFEKAKTLLEEAGWTDTDGNGIVDKEIDGQRVDLELEFLYTPGSNFQENLSALVQENAKKVGIEIERVPVESNVMGERLRNRDYEMAGRGAGASPVNDDPKQLFHTDSDNPGGTNYARFGTPETDSLIEAIRTAPTDEARLPLYLKLQEIIYDEQPIIFLFAPQDKIVVHKRFDAVITRQRPGVSLRHLKLNTGS